MPPPEGELQPNPDAAMPEPPADPASEPASAPTAVAASGTEVIAPTPSFTWEASEYVFHEKPFTWYLVLAVVVVLLWVVLGLTHQWLSMVVVAAMAVTVVIFSRKEPRTLSYALDEQGISIGGQLSSYHLFRSYSVRPELGWQEIDLEPARRFAPRLTILCDHDGFDPIEEILSQHLPRHDREPDWVEHFTRYIKF